MAYYFHSPGALSPTDKTSLLATTRLQRSSFPEKPRFFANTFSLLELHFAGSTFPSNIVRQHPLVSALFQQGLHYLLRQTKGALPITKLRIFINIVYSLLSPKVSFVPLHLLFASPSHHTIPLQRLNFCLTFSTVLSLLFPENHGLPKHCSVSGYSQCSGTSNNAKQAHLVF